MPLSPPTATATPAPTPEATPSPTPTPAANLAPDHILYITRRVVLQTEDSLQLLADLGERVEIVSRNGSKIRVRSEKGVEFEVDEELTTNDLDEMNAVVVAHKERRQAGAVAAKALQQANAAAAAMPTPSQENEQQKSLRKARVRELQAAIAGAEKRRGQLHAEYSQSVNDWGNRYTRWDGQVYYAKKADVTAGSAPDSAENKNRARETQRLDQQIAAWRTELQQLERALAAAQ